MVTVLEQRNCFTIHKHGEKQWNTNTQAKKSQTIHFPHKNQDGHNFNNNNKIQVKATFEIGNKHTKYVLSLKAARNVFYWLLLEVGCYKKTSKVELQTEILKKIKMFSQ